MWLGLMKKNEKQETNRENYRSDKESVIWINAFFEGENSKKDEKLFKVVQKRDGGDDGTVEEKEDEMRGCIQHHTNLKA